MARSQAASTRWRRSGCPTSWTPPSTTRRRGRPGADGGPCRRSRPDVQRGCRRGRARHGLQRWRRDRRPGLNAGDLRPVLLPGRQRPRCTIGRNIRKHPGRADRRPVDCPGSRAGRLRQTIDGAGAAEFGGPAMNFVAPSDAGADRVVTFWGQALGSRSTYDGNSDVSEATSTFGGVFGGVDVTMGPNGVVGSAAGYGGSDTSVDALDSSADADTYMIAAYGGVGSAPGTSGGSRLLDGQRRGPTDGELSRLRRSNERRLRCRDRPGIRRSGLRRRRPGIAWEPSSAWPRYASTPMDLPRAEALQRCPPIARPRTTAPRPWGCGPGRATRWRTERLFATAFRGLAARVRRPGDRSVAGLCRCVWRWLQVSGVALLRDTALIDVGIDFR